jgi:hypothetical protein
MRLPELARVESEAVHDFAQVMKVDDLLAPPSSAGQRPLTVPQSGIPPCGMVLPLRLANWSLTSLHQRWVKTGGRLIRHSRYDWLLRAESVAAATGGGCSGRWYEGLRSCRCRLGRRRRSAQSSRATRR